MVRRRDRLTTPRSGRAEVVVARFTIGWEIVAT
jgi:hypothetical protein